jgi:hypothetical protein
MRRTAAMMPTLEDGVRSVFPGVRGAPDARGQRR